MAHRRVRILAAPGSAPPNELRAVFDAIHAKYAVPQQFSADVDTPGDSRIQFSARTADSVAAIPPATSYPVHLAQGLTPDTPVGGIMLDSDQGGAMTPPSKSSRNTMT